MMIFRDPEIMSHDQLIDYVNELEGYIEGMSPKTDRTIKLRSTFGLTEAESMVVQVLATGRPCRLEHLRTIASKGGETSTDVVRVHISRIRRKLNPHGIEIECLWNGGYQMVAGQGVIAAAEAA